jgi:DNA-directed RNA polymerase subunit omega
MIEALKSDEIVKKLGGRFKLTALIQRRLVELMDGARPLVERKGRSDLQIVIEEIVQGKIMPKEPLPEGYEDEDDLGMSSESADDLSPSLEPAPVAAPVADDDDGDLELDEDVALDDDEESVTADPDDEEKAVIQDELASSGFEDAMLDGEDDSR